MAHLTPLPSGETHDAVVAARDAYDEWSSRPAPERALALLRLADGVESRRAQFVESVREADQLDAASAQELVDASVGRLFWYAGWADKLGTVLGRTNQVSGPYDSLTTPEPLGVVAVVAPRLPSLLGLVSVIAPVVVTGNTCVVVTPTSHPRSVMQLFELMTLTGLPQGVVTMMSGEPLRAAQQLAADPAIDALDLTGIVGTGILGNGAVVRELEVTAANQFKPVRRPPEEPPDWLLPPRTDRISAHLRVKTVWRTLGT